MLYVHIPYCNGKCIYCDFYSAGKRIAQWEVYKDCLLEELKQRKDEFRRIPETIYFGGGTPSLLPDNIFISLVDEINTILNKSKEWSEFTIEVNPEDITELKCEAWKNAGVNRVSMGVQSLIDSELKKIGRKHDSKTAIQAIKILKNYFENISVDIMFGLPGQTLNSLRQSVETLISFRPTHFSAYALMLEEGTALTHLASKGIISLPGEEETLEMWKLLSGVLKENGFRRYEISNYAVAGYESKHNSGYWQGKAYMGLGPSAHSYDGNNIRKWNNADIKNYIRHYSGDSSFIFEKIGDEETLSKEELLEEMIMTRLRTAKGLNLNEFKEKLGEIRLDKLLKKANTQISLGFLQRNQDHLSLLETGFYTSDTVFLELI